MNPFDLVEKKYHKIPKVHDEQLFWDTEKSYEIFYKFLQLGPTRKLIDVYRDDPNYKEGRSVPSNWISWKSSKKWNERIEQWDLEQEYIEQEAKREAYVKAQEKELESLKIFQQLMGKTLKSSALNLLKKFNAWTKTVSFEDMEVREVLLTFKAITEAIDKSEHLIESAIGLEEILELLDEETDDHDD